jgi:hypothetical protein
MNIQVIISALLMWFMPIPVGNIFRGWKKEFQEPKDILLSWVLGVLALFAVQLGVSQIAPAFVTPAIIVIFGIGIVWILPVCRLLIQLLITHIVPIMISLSFMLFACGTWYRDIPPTASVNWDLFEHQTLVNIMLHGKMSFVTSQLSDTFRFNGYSTLFHSILASVQRLIPVEPLPFWWMTQHIYTFFAVLAGFVLMKTITKRTLGGILGAATSAFLFESSVIYSPFFLIPQTMCALLGALTLSYVIYSYNEHKSFSWGILVTFFIAMILMHYIVGTVCVLGILLYITFLHRIFQHQNVMLTTIGILSLGVFAGGLFLPVLKPELLSINFGEASSYSYDFIQKFRFFHTWYGFGFELLAPFGILTLLFSKKQTLRAFGAISLLFLMLVMTPIPYIEKTYAFGRYIILAVMAMSVFHISNFSKHIFVKGLASGIFIFGMLVILIVNSEQWKFENKYMGKMTHVSPSEIEATKYIKTHYGTTDTLLISDPATQNIFEGLSDVNSQGGAYMNESSRRILHDVFGVKTLQISALSEIKDSVVKDKPDTTLLVVTSRYFSWIKLPLIGKLDITVNEWYPKSMTLEDYKDKKILIDSINAPIIFENSNVVVFDISDVVKGAL